MMKWMDGGQIHLLGSDCHDMQKRPPRMKEALEAIRNDLGDKAAEKLEAVSSRLIAGKPLRGDHLFF
jgi:protein-tyrosine phosphatase